MDKPDDIARSGVNLVFDGAKFVAGSELVVDGSYTER